MQASVIAAPIADGLTDHFIRGGAPMHLAELLTLPANERMQLANALFDSHVQNVGRVLELEAPRALPQSRTPRATRAV